MTSTHLTIIKNLYEEVRTLKTYSEEKDFFLCRKYGFEFVKRSSRFVVRDRFDVFKFHYDWLGVNENVIQNTHLPKLLEEFPNNFIAQEYIYTDKIIKTKYIKGQLLAEISDKTSYKKRLNEIVHKVRLKFNLTLTDLHDYNVMIENGTRDLKIIDFFIK